jgi:hypothetical protein
LGQVFDRVRQRVDALSGGRQTPWSNSSVIGAFYFRGGSGVSRPPSGISSPAVSEAELARREELAYWEAIKDSQIASVFQEYLKRFGEGGRFTVPARARLEALTRPAASNAPNTAPPSSSNPGSIIGGILGSADPSTAGIVPPKASSRTPDVIYVPTPSEVVEAMLQLASVGANDVVYDLGSGDGRIPIAAAKKGARGIGIEIQQPRR